jgi:integrase
MRTCGRRRGGAGAAVAVVAFLLVLAPVHGRTRESAVSEGTAGHLGVRSSLRELLNHPAFGGFGHRLLPWDDHAYDENMPVTDIGSLLPYHSDVDPETLASALNRNDRRLPVLAAFPEPSADAPWRWVAAACVYSGLRPGEAFGPHKDDLDTTTWTLAVRRSWTEPMPKDGDARDVVVVPELRPHLARATAASTSDAVFSRADEGFERRAKSRVPRGETGPGNRRRVGLLGS